MDFVTLQTDRLLLRPWIQEDEKPFIEMNQDPRVMEFFPSLLSADESLSYIKKYTDHFKKYGWGFWVTVLKGSCEFIGFIGLRYDDFEAPFTPCVEIGWRLKSQFWGNGYATEGAKAALKFGFKTLQLKEIISFTYENNHRSRMVMERLSMKHNPVDDFNNPKLPKDHWLSRHVLYRLTRDEWQHQYSN